MAWYHGSPNYIDRFKPDGRSPSDFVDEMIDHHAEE